MKTKGEIEAENSRALVQFEIDYMGRGPKEARTYIIEDMLVVRLKGVLTPAEEQLTKTGDGGELVKKAHDPHRKSEAASLSGRRRHFRHEDLGLAYRHQHRFRRTGLCLHVGIQSREAVGASTGVLTSAAAIFIKVSV